MRRWLWVASVGILVLASVGAFRPRQEIGRESQAPGLSVHAKSLRPTGLQGITLQITLGVGDPQPFDWSGEIRLSQGRVLRLEARLAQDERIGGNRWQLRSRGTPVRPARLWATLEAPPTAQVEVETKRGSFSFALEELPLGSSKTFLQGSVVVERVPLTVQVAGEGLEEDFPAVAMGSEGEVWCAYVAYRRGNPIVMEEVERGKFDSLETKGNGDEVRLVRYDGRGWSRPIRVSGEGLDVWRPAVGVAGGKVWVVWSQRIGEDWELMGRVLDWRKGEMREVKRLTWERGADLNAVVGVRRGEVWVAWQGWRGDHFDIWLGKWGAKGLEGVERVSFSGANDWCPALGVDREGRIWVAWDSYEKGDYDVYVRSWEGGRLGEVVGVATSGRFEARPSLAVDGEGRVWVAYEEGGENWGKDFGQRWEGKSGVSLYLDRNIVVRCLQEGRLWQTKAQVRSELIQTHYDDKRRPTELRHRISFPRLGVDAQGRVWLTFRRHPLVTAGGERWVSFATYYDGDEWSPQILLPRSENFLDNRPAMVPLAGGMLFVYSSDGRTAGTGSAQDNNLYATWLQAEGAPGPALLVAVRPEGKAAEPVHPQETREVRRARSYRVRVGGKTYLLLRGEFHRHTELTSHRDWDGPMEDMWRYGLDVAKMDWIGPGDHDAGYGQEYAWWLTQKQVDLYHHPPHFVPMFTYERSVPYPSGHRNVMFARRGIRALPRLGGKERQFGTPEAGAPDVKNLYAYLKRFDGICASHTSATDMGTDWRDNDPQAEPVVEIYQGHRQNYEEPKAPLAPRDAEDSIQGYHPAGFVWNALAKGYRLGFQVSSDHVSTHISYAMVYAEEPSRQAILEAFKRRRCYGAMDNIILDVRCGEHWMGEEFTSRSLPTLSITVIGTAPIAQIDIVRQMDKAMPAYVYAFRPQGSEVRGLRWMDKEAHAGSVLMYYVRVIQEDGKLAWASPLWVHYRP